MSGQSPEAEREAIERFRRAYDTLNRNHPPRRTPEAESQIAAAHAPPTGIEIAMQEIDRAREVAERETANPPNKYRAGDGPPRVDHDVMQAREFAPRAFDQRGAPDRTHEMLLPAENGGPKCNHVRWMGGCPSCATWAIANGVAFARHMVTRPVPPAPIERFEGTAVGPTDLLLTGSEAERYRVLQTAARAAHDAAQAAQATGAALRDAFHAVVNGTAKEP